MIGIPSAPTLSVCQTGLYTVFVPSVESVKAFSNWLWSTDILDKLFIDPLSLIVGMYMSPIRPTNISAVTDIKIGGRNSNVKSSYVLNEYYLFNFGTLNLSEYFGNFLDYQGTGIIYLPYIGYKQIDLNDFLSGTINVQYWINFATGICIAFLVANRGNVNAVVYQYEGNIFNEIPLTSQNAATFQSSILNSMMIAGVGIASGNALTTTQGLVSSATNILNTNKNFERSGNLGKNGGYLSVQQCYILLQRPVQSISAGMRKDIGYVSNIYSELSNLKGYTKVLYIDLSGISCTDDERQRLMQMLKEGVYF
ncbi:MAG: hypothetical protein NC200_02655 [Candidatus Gastranaerophilales bacterium]|nr:hypothetical protein [Candidatus Gastranaerophilales bacterium]